MKKTAVRLAALAGSLIAAAGIAVIFANQVSLNVPPIALLALVMLLTAGAGALSARGGTQSEGN